MPFEFQAVPALRAAAWILLLALALRVLLRRPDAAGRAFAFWAFVWAGGIQLVLSLQVMATDAPTQQVLFRAAYYAILVGTPAFLLLLLYVPRRQSFATPAAAGLLALAALLCITFAGSHGAFLAEAVVDGTYASANAGAMQFLFPVVVWGGFLAGMAWLAWRVPHLEGAARRSATWVMAGLALFAADRFARTAALWVRDPSTLGAPPEGQVYGLFMLAFGVAVVAMALRTRALPDGANVGLAALLGGAVGATAIATFDGATTVPVLLSALLAPLYGALIAQGVREAPAEAEVPARAGRAAVLTEADADA